MILQFVELWNFADGLLQLLLQLLHVVLIHDEVLTGSHHIGSDHLRSSGRILEIAAHRFLDLDAAVHQPQHDEQCHHRGHEIRVRHLPGPAVVAAMAHFLLDDNWWWSGHRYAGFSAGGATAASPPLSLMYFSVS